MKIKTHGYTIHTYTAGTNFGTVAVARGGGEERHGPAVGLGSEDAALRALARALDDKPMAGPEGRLTGRPIREALAYPAEERERTAREARTAGAVSDALYEELRGCGLDRALRILRQAEDRITPGTLTVSNPDRLARLVERLLRIEAQVEA